LPSLRPEPFVEARPVDVDDLDDDSKLLGGLRLVKAAQAHA
jgi:hypothetical protein